MVKPAKLLEDFGMLWITVEDTSISRFGRVKLATISNVLQVHADDLRLFVARARGRSGTRCPPLLEDGVDHEQYI